VWGQKPGQLALPYFFYISFLNLLKIILFTLEKSGKIYLS